MILEDDTHTEWTWMDYRLAKAYHLREDFLSGGVPIYWDQSDRVTFEIKKSHSKSGRVIEQFEHGLQKAKTPDFGLRYWAEPRTIDGGPLPTMEEWQEEQKGKKAMSPTTDAGDPRKRGLKPNAGWAGAKPD